jgi:hypothetical protein
MDKERSAIMNGKKKAIIIIVAVIAVAFVGLVISSYFWPDTYPIWTEISFQVKDNGKVIRTAKIPLPENSKHLRDELNKDYIDYFITDKSANEVKQFFSDYTSKLIKVVNGSNNYSKSAYYDPQQGIVIIDYEVLDGNENCQFSIVYNKYSDDWTVVNQQQG